LFAEKKYVEVFVAVISAPQFSLLTSMVIKSPKNKESDFDVYEFGD
jgi:hypothetical protein